MNTSFQQNNTHLLLSHFLSDLTSLQHLSHSVHCLRNSSTCYTSVLTHCSTWHDTVQACSCPGTASFISYHWWFHQLASAKL